MLKRYDKEQVEQLIERQQDGANTRFLKSAHNLWYRFKNYERNPPFVLEDNSEPVALVFITFSQKSKYANLYEIVTLEGKEVNGYGTEIYWLVMENAYNNNMQILKMSCTPSSVSWHKRNGNIFWAVDPSGSLRADQPIFPNLHEQLTFRELAIKDPSIALPKSQKVLDQLMRESLESHGFGEKKRLKTKQAISKVGNYWFRDVLFKQKSTLEEFIS